MSAHAKQGSEVHLPDPGRRGARARERLRRYRSGKCRIDFYPDEDSAAVIAALVSPDDSASAVINWLIREAVADGRDAGGRPDPSK
jgi:hypothetical protein